MTQRLIVALDTADRRQALEWAEAASPYCGLLKLGLEFYLANGPEGVRAITQAPIFLDLKLHDIPNTVAGAVRSLAAIAPAMLTLHAAGGSAMIAAARKAADEVPHPPKLLAVTVLTSLDQPALNATGIAGTPSDQVLRLAELALSSGADGLVCSAHEVSALRLRFGTAPLLVVPGIRPKGAAHGDQARVMTPREAVLAGADYIVVGRPVTAAADPGAAAKMVAAEAA
jgi:orotidine-5'-phosphate decarboxylase